MDTFYKAQMSYNNLSLHIWTSDLVSCTELDHQSLIWLRYSTYENCPDGWPFRYPAANVFYLTVIYSQKHIAQSFIYYFIDKSFQQHHTAV